MFTIGEIKTSEGGFKPSNWYADEISTTQLNNRKIVKF